MRTSVTGEVCPLWSTYIFFKPTSEFFSTSICPSGSSEETREVTSAGKKRGSYAMISEELKAKVAKYAAENSVSALLNHLKSAQELDLKESSVCGWVTMYQKRLDFIRKASDLWCQEAGPRSLAVNWKSK